MDFEEGSEEDVDEVISVETTKSILFPFFPSSKS